MAAPGEEPQTAVVPGSTRQRLMSHPSTLEAKTVAATTPRKSGHSARNTGKMPGEIDAAIRQPTMDCAAANRGVGILTVAPLMPQTMPANIGPMSRAAGSAANSSSATNSSESARITSHWKGRLTVARRPVGDGCGSVLMNR